MFVMFQMFHFGFLQVLEFKVMFQCSNVPKKYGPVTGEVEERGMAKSRGTVAGTIHYFRQNGTL